MKKPFLYKVNIAMNETTGGRYPRAAMIALKLGTIGLALALWGCGRGSEKDNGSAGGEEPIPVRVLTIEPATFDEFGVYYGNLSPVVEATLVSYQGGRVTRVEVREGERVRAGSSLAGIEPDKADAQLETATLNEKIANEAHERAATLFEDGNLSQVNLDQARLGWFHARSARIDAQKAWRGQMCITPITGVVLSRFIEPHQELGPGSPTFTVGDISRMQVRVGIPEGELPGVGKGSSARMLLDLFPDRVWEGELTRLAPQVHSHSRVAAAHLVVDNQDGALQPGMTVRVELLRRRHEGVVVIPSGALMSGDRGSYVALAADEGVAQLRMVGTGPSNRTHTVIELGLQPGEKVLVAGQHLVADGSPVQVRESGERQQAW